MKKVLWGIFGLLVILVIAGVLFVFFGWSRVPDWLASQLEERFQVHVSIDDVHVTWDSIDIQKLEIGNPSGYKLPKAFSAEQILIEAPLKNYVSSQVVIDKMELDNIFVGIEFNKQGSKKGNWTVLMNNLDASEEQHKGKSKPVLIKKLILNNIDITLAYRDGSKRPQKLKPIRHLEFDNITSEEGLPMDQITAIIMRQVLKSVFTLENLGNMLLEGIEKPYNAPKMIIKPFKSLFGF